MKITPRQARFVAEYLVDLNATQAAIRAGYSKKTADRIGPRLLGNVGVRTAIEAGQAKRLSKLEITAERVLQELAIVAFADPKQLFDAEGNLLAIADLPSEVTRALASVEVKREITGTNGHRTESEVVTKVRAWNKVDALEKLARHLGLLKDRLQIETVPPLQVIIDDDRRD